MTPHVSNTHLDNRGFHKKNQTSKELLETVGSIFLAGYGNAVEARSISEARRKLERVTPRYRGFAYEGAAMGYAMLDGLPLFGSTHTTDFLTGAGARHSYMAYVGIGWAMARLPRMRWPRADRFDPLLRWLILDGYGFHQAYFHTQRYVRERYVDPAFHWPGANNRNYCLRAVDQGIGRAMWFVGGTDADVVASMIEGFPEARRGDLYGGVGLAATYAGGADTEELAELSQRAGGYSAELAQGSAFAAEARIRAGLMVPHTGVATLTLCGKSPEQAAHVTQALRPEFPIDGAVPAYESWRQSIAAELESVGGVRN